MGIKHSQSIWIGILALCLFSSVALADPVQDTARAEEAFRIGDLVNAMTLFRQAGNQGYAPAQIRFGELLDVAELNEEAVSWYRKAAAQGDASGEFHLAGMYAIGEGVKKDTVKALKLIHSAADKNYLPAVKQLAQIYRTGGLGLMIDIPQSQLWESKAQALKKSAAAAKKMKKNAQGHEK